MGDKESESYYDYQGQALWCAFFLQAVQAQAEENQLKAQSILNLYESLKPRFAELTHSQYSIHALDWLFQRPIFKSSDFVHCPEIPDSTAKRILNLLKKEDIVTTIIASGGSRAALLAFPMLLDVAERGNYF